MCVHFNFIKGEEHSKQKLRFFLKQTNTQTNKNKNKIKNKTKQKNKNKTKQNKKKNIIVILKQIVWEPKNGLRF